MTDIHVMPVGDLREHDSNPQCWCRPVQDPEVEEVWLHNSMDRREHTLEKGRTQ